MSWTFQRAVRGHLTGRLTGTGSEHVTVAVLGSHLLAVRLDGMQYVVWTWGVNLDDTVSVYWGHYFDVRDYPDAYTAFKEAVAELESLEA